MVRGRQRRILSTTLRTGVIGKMSVNEEQAARNVYEHLRIKVEVLTEQVETTVSTAPVSVPALRLRVESTREAWEQFGLQYAKLRNATFDTTQYAALQRRFYAAIALAETALIEDE